MPKHLGLFLLDTYVILECRRVDGWRALAGAYRLETVEECIGETQTGYQRRRPEHQIEPTELRLSPESVQSVGDLERAVLAVRIPDIALDLGKASLWAHALIRDDEWILCGPDKASQRVGVRLDFRDRLVVLEQLYGDIDYRTKIPLKGSYTSKLAGGSLWRLGSHGSKGKKLRLCPSGLCDGSSAPGLSPGTR